MTSQPGKETITIHILPNTSINKSNQTMKLGQLITCKTLFFKTPTQNMLGNYSQTLF